nr:hypothetical protein B0A51_08437 [Rachicladosporium sp. CCFEE 5018]
MASHHCALTSRALWSAFIPARTSPLIVPTFLAPSLAQRSNFSTTTPVRSKIGSAPLSLPPDVTFTITPTSVTSASRTSPRNAAGSSVEITGPQGKLSLSIPSYMSIEVDEEKRTRTLRIQDADERKQREMWGTVRAYLANHILGVSEGHTAILRLVGVGYRATVENKAITKSPAYDGQKFVSLKVGYSHPIELGIPVGVKASTPQPTRILLEGAEREVVMQFAAEIRAWRKPEPYKGKGIFVNGETIKLKAKKIK